MCLDLEILMFKEEERERRRREGGDRVLFTLQISNMGVMVFINEGRGLDPSFLSLPATLYSNEGT